VEVQSRKNLCNGKCSADVAAFALVDHAKYVSAIFVGTLREIPNHLFRVSGAVVVELSGYTGHARAHVFPVFPLSSNINNGEPWTMIALRNYDLVSEIGASSDSPEIVSALSLLCLGANRSGNLVRRNFTACRAAESGSGSGKISAVTQPL